MVKRKQEKRMYSSKEYVAKVETPVGGAGLSVEKQTETAVNKKTEEQLINSFLEPQYRTCYVHLVHCEMDVQARNCRKNDLNLSDFRIEVNSNNKRVVHYVAQNKKVKFNVKFREDVSLTKEERNYSIEEDTLKKSPNSSLKGVLETSVSKKTQIRIRRPSYSRQSNNNSNNNDNKDSGQLISRNTVLDEGREGRWKSSVTNNSKYSRKRRKSLSTTDVEEHNGNKCSDKFNIKNPCFTKNVSVKKKNLTRNSLCENARGIYRSEKKQEESHVEVVTDNEEYDEERLNRVNRDSAKMSVSSDTKERISTKIEPSSLNIITSQNKLSPVNYSGVQQNDNGKYILIKTPAEKKMYEEKLYDLELAKVGKCDPKQVTENYVGESKSGTEDQDCSVMRVDKNNKQKKIVKVSTALVNNVKTKRKLGNTENVVESKLPVVSEDRLSRFDQQGDSISRKKINTIQKGTVKIPANSVAKQLSKKSILKHNEGDDNNNEDKNVCITKHERKNSREDTAETISSFCTRNLSSSETLDSSDQVISDKVEHCSKSSDLRNNSIKSDKQSKGFCNKSSDLQNNSIKTDKQSKGLIDQCNVSSDQGQCRSGDDQDERHKNRNALESQNVSINGEQNQHRNISDESKRVNSDNEEQSTKHVTITGEKDHTEQNQHMSSDEQDESSSSDDEEHSFKRITVSSEHDHHAEQVQHMSSSEQDDSSNSDDGEQSSKHVAVSSEHDHHDAEQDESSSSNEEGRSVSDFEQIHRTSIIIQKRTSDSDDDDDNEDGDNGQIRYTNSVKQNKAISDDDDDNKEIHRTIAVKRKQVVSDSDDDDDDKHIHRASSVKQNKMVNDDSDKQLHSVSDKNRNQNVNNDGQSHHAHSGKQSTLKSDDDDGKQIQCMSGEKQSQNLSDDDHEGEGISGDEQDQSVNYSEINQHIRKLCFNNSSSFSDIKSEKTIKKHSPEKMPPPAPPPMLRNRSVRNDKKNCKEIMRRLSSDCSSEKSSAPCVNSIPAAVHNGDDNGDDSDDNCSDVLSLFADTEIMDFVTTCALKSSVPNPFLHTTAAPKKDAFGARGNHCSGMSTITDTVTNSVVSDSVTKNCDNTLQSSDKNYDAYNFGRKVSEHNRNNRNFALPEVFHDHETHNTKYGRNGGFKNIPSDISCVKKRGNNPNTASSMVLNYNDKHGPVADKVTGTADFETSRNRYGYKNCKPSVSYVNNKSPYSDTVHSVPDATTNDNYETEALATDKRLKVYPHLADVPKKTVSASNSHSSISEDSSEIKSTNTAVKLNFRIPKIVKTSKTESDEDNSVSEKNDRQHNDVLKRDTVLSKRYPGPSVGKDVEYDGRITKTSVKTSSPERAKDSQVLEKNVKYGPIGLLRREIVFTKRSPEPSAGKETEYGRTPKINVNTCSTESIKASPIPEKNGKFRSNELLTRETMPMKRGPEPSSVKETESGRIPKMYVKTGNTDRGKVSPVVEKNDKCKSNESLTREIVSTKRGLEPSSVKETESDRVPKFDVKTGNTSRGKVSPVSEKRDKCGQNDSLTREIVLTSKRSPITFERKETEHGSNRRKLVEEVSQECKIIKLGSSLPLTEKKMGGDSENNGRKIVLKDSPELKISKEGLESSAGKEQDCGTVQRKTVGRDSAVPEKKLRSDDSPKLLTGNQTYGKSPETATNGNEERTERPAAGRPKHLAEAFNLVRKGAFNTAVAANKDSQSQVGASSAEPMGTTPRRHMKIKISNERSLPTDHMNSEEYEKSVRLNTLFAGCCMTYLRTSKCDPPCSLSHNVGLLLIVKSSNKSADDMQLKSLEDFLSEAPKPPLSVIDSLCTTFVVHQRADAIFSVNKIFTKRCAYSDSEYMRNLLKILIHALRQCYGSTESSLAAIVKYLCKDVELNDSRQEILDKVVTTIEETVKVDHRWDIFSGLTSVKDYVWSQTLLDSVLDDFTVKHERYLLESKNLNAVRDYASVLLRASQEEHLFNIWKRFQARLSKLCSLIKQHHMSVKTLRAKINWFEYVDSTVGHYMPRAQFRQVYREGDTRETELSSTNNLVTASEDVEKHSRISGMSRAESRNVTGVSNRLLCGDKVTVNIPKFNNRSVDSVENVADPVDQKWSDNTMKFNQPWTVTSVSGSHNSEFSDVCTRSSGFERQHSAGDSGVCSNDNKRLSRNEHFLVPQPCDFNITENETYLQKLENQSQNTPSLSHYNLVDDSLDNREENSVNMFTRQCEKRECPVLENKTVAHMNGQYQLRGMSGGSVFQNASSNSSSKANLSVVHNNDDETDHRKFATYNSNNIERNVQRSNNRNYYPRPSGYRERLNQFNEDRHSTAVHDAQHLQQQSSTKSESPSEANKTLIIQYPLEITEPCSSKSSNNFNSYDSFLSNGNTAEQHVHDRKPFLPTDCRRLKRSRSTTSLPFNVQKSESTGSTTRVTTKDDSCLLRVGNTGNLPNNGGRCYSLQEHETYCSKVYLPSKCTKNMASSTNHVEQVRKRFSALSNEYSEKNQWTTNFYNGRAQNTRPKHPGGESHGIGSVVNMRTESDDIPSTSSGLNSGRTSVPPSMKLSANLPCETFHQNDSNTDRFNEGSMSNSGQQSTVRLQSGYSALPNHDSSTSVTIRRRTSKLKLAELDEDAMYAKQFLEVNDYHHVLNLFDKWQNTEQMSDLTKHVFVTIADVEEKTGYDKCYNTFRGLLSTAINSGKLSTVMRKSLASIALNLVLDMVIAESWLFAHEIVNLILDHELPFSSSKVYRDDQYSPAGRNLIFAEVCMQCGELEKAVILLNKHSMLAMDRKEWSLRSVNRDMAIRNHLIKTLLDRTITSDNLDLSYSFLINLMEAQRDITQPINLVMSYELLLRKLLDLTDSCMGLQLFKEIRSYHDVPVVVDGILCRALVVACFNENEIELAKQLVKRGYFIGAYTRNTHLFTVKINSVWTRAEMNILIEEALNTVFNSLKKRSTISTAAIDCDLHFAVVEGGYKNKSLPKLLMGVDSSLSGATYRLKSVLSTGFYPALYENSQESDSPYVVVKKSVMVKYFSYHLQNSPRS